VPFALLTEEQAAELLALSVRTLQAWRLRGTGARFVRAARNAHRILRSLEQAEKRQGNERLPSTYIVVGLLSNRAAQDTTHIRMLSAGSRAWRKAHGSLGRSSQPRVVRTPPIR
jgi:hypothetical protein